MECKLKGEEKKGNRGPRRNEEKTYNNVKRVGGIRVLRKLISMG